MAKFIKIYDTDNYSKVINGLEVIRTNKTECVNKISSRPLQIEQPLTDSLNCSTCNVSFGTSVTLQREHYKSDWHRYNLKQNMKSLEPVTEEYFMQIVDDVSSISGSESSEDDEDEDMNKYALHRSKIYFRNEHGEIVSLYRCLLHDKKNVFENDEDYIKSVREYTTIQNTYWTVLMLSGGHFAGAVFEGDRVVVHKTFHLYTVRARQGGSQGAYDRSGSHAKSAGASLRRYNEQALVQHVGDLLHTWSTYISQSKLVFYHAAGPYNRSVIFGGKIPILNKQDPRLRTIPFSTKRPTFTELQRVHNTLSTIEVSTELPEEILLKQTRVTHPKRTANRSKSRDNKKRELPGAQIGPESSSENEQEFILDTSSMEISFAELKPFESTRKPKIRKNIRKNVNEFDKKRDLFIACSTNNLELVKNLLENDPATLMNVPIDKMNNSVLHVAALSGNVETILWLLDHGASPSNRNNLQQTPYTITSDKIVRQTFRTYALENPEKYNYTKAQIPTAIPKVKQVNPEVAEKRKAQKKLKREREQEKRKEEEETERFLKLSDREKRALAAERRLLAQSSAVLVRCFLCGVDISGKVPFEYSGNRFCSINCLKAHRMQNPVLLS